MVDVACLSKEDDCRPEKRSQSDVIFSRLALLDPADRVMVEMHLLHGVSYKELGLLTGEKSQTLARRVDHCVRRLLGGQYIVVVRNRQCFSPEELAVAYDSFLLGMGYRTIAKKRGLGTGTCRGMVKRLKERVKQF